MFKRSKVPSDKRPSEKRPTEKRPADRGDIPKSKTEDIIEVIVPPIKKVIHAKKPKHSSKKKSKDEPNKSLIFVSKQPTKSKIFEKKPVDNKSIKEKKTRSIKKPVKKIEVQQIKTKTPEKKVVELPKSNPIQDIDSITNKTLTRPLKKSPSTRKDSKKILKKEMDQKLKKIKAKKPSGRDDVKDMITTKNVGFVKQKKQKREAPVTKEVKLSKSEPKEKQPKQKIPRDQKPKQDKPVSKEPKQKRPR